MTQYVIYWILLVPVTLLSAKWYFKEDSPTLKKGLLLGLIGLAVGIVLDLIITVPLFIKSYSEFYSQWELYVGFAIFLLVCMYAGFEFDATYTKDKSVKEVEKEEDLTEE